MAEYILTGIKYYLLAGCILSLYNLISFSYFISISVQPAEYRLTQKDLIKLIPHYCFYVVFWIINIWGDLWVMWQFFLAIITRDVFTKGWRN